MSEWKMEMETVLDSGGPLTDMERVELGVRLREAENLIDRAWLDMRSVRLTIVVETHP